MFPVSVIAPHPTVVVYDILFGGVISLSMMCMYTETFPVSVIAPNPTVVVYEILFDDMHPTTTYRHFSGHCTRAIYTIRLLRILEISGSLHSSSFIYYLRTRTCTGLVNSSVCALCTKVTELSGMAGMRIASDGRIFYSRKKPTSYY